MSDKTADFPNMEVPDNKSDDFHVEGGEPGSERTARLRLAIADAGGPRAVSQKSGVPFGTLQAYRAGGELKLSNAIAIAEATSVRLEWLATGTGPMREGAAAAPPVDSQPAGPLLLFGKVKIDRLVRAYEGALATTGGQDRRLTMHLTILLHDQLVEAEEASKTAD